MEDFVSASNRGFLRSIIYFFAEVIFWRLCYLAGWPLCKVITLGRYPGRQSAERAIFRHRNTHTGFTCAAVGLLILCALLLIFTGYWPAGLPSLR